MYAEFCIARKLNHPNIIKYKYFVRQFNPDSQQHDFHNLIEFVKGEDLTQFVQRNGALPINQVKKFGLQILSGIKYLHENQIFHKDLKPANVLLSADLLNIKIIDFGLSTKIDQNEENKQSKMAGTMKYMSPEQINGIQSFKCDIWAFGCILLTLLTGTEPFSNLDNVNACLKININKQSPLDYMAEHQKVIHRKFVELNPDFKSLLLMCFNFDYETRPSAQ